MANINRDYQIIVDTGFGQYNKPPKITYKDELIFRSKDKGTCNFFIILKPFSADLKLEMRVLSPNNNKFTITPQFLGLGTDDMSYVFLVDLKEEEKNEIGRYKFEIVVATEDGHRTLLFQYKYRVKK